MEGTSGCNAPLSGSGSHLHSQSPRPPARKPGLAREGGGIVALGGAPQAAARSPAPRSGPRLRLAPPSWRGRAVSPDHGAWRGQRPARVPQRRPCRRGPRRGSLALPGDLPRQLRPHPRRGRVLLPEAHQHAGLAVPRSRQRYLLGPPRPPCPAPHARAPREPGWRWPRCRVSSREASLRTQQGAGWSHGSQA